MIVRNEAHVILETLECARPYITDFLIVDTGSTDDTIQLIEAHFAAHGIPGRVLERPWRSFGENRSEALELARQHSDSEYLWVLDADDVLSGKLALSGLTADAYSLRFGPDLEYWRLQIFRREAPWRYVGIVHEYPQCDLPAPRTERIKGRYHVVSRRLGDRNRDPDKYRKDAMLLEAALEVEPDNARHVFYLGQSWFDAGEPRKAMDAYQRRVGLGGWQEEVFYSRYRLAQCLERLDMPRVDVRAAYEECLRHHPGRAESLVRMARRERLDGNYEKAYEDASRAVAIPHPGAGGLFVENAVYVYRARDELAIAAYYLGCYREAFEVNADLLTNAELPDQERQRIEANRDFSVAHIKDDYLQADGNLVRAILEREPAETPLVTLTITSCRRLDLFVKTVRSFLKACLDIDLIDRWICIDDNSDEADRREMERAFPFFEFIWKGPDDRGHARSMNLLIEQVRTPYWLHLEDDWQFFEPLPYIGHALEILDADSTLGQVLFNRHYAEELADRQLVGGRARQTPAGRRYVEHLYLPKGSEGYAEFWKQHRGSLSNAYWPHYSLRPSVLRTGVMKSLAPFNQDAQHFELEMAKRYQAAGGRSAFLDTISALHIGRLTSQRESGDQLNAYALNRTEQFGESVQGGVNPDTVTVTITSCKRLEYFIQTMDSFLRCLEDRETVSEWICIDDNSTAADRAQMAERFPFFRFIHKTPDETGHAKSMNRLLNEIDTRYVLHLEDDWDFSRGFRLTTLTRLLRETHSHQLVLCPRPGCLPLCRSEDDVPVYEYVYAPHHPEKPESYRNYDLLNPPEPARAADHGWWWPGFSLNPSVLDIDFFRTRVGLFDEKIAFDTFEYDYAAHAHAAGARILVADYGVTHIGKQPAYVLNQMPRWWDAE